jgi:hypothetical protein
MHRHFAALREIEDQNIDSSSETSNRSGTAIDLSDSTYEYNEFEVFHEFEDGYLRTDIPIKEASFSHLHMPGSESTPSFQQASSSDDPGDSSIPPSPSSRMKQIVHPPRSEFTNLSPPSSFRPIDERSSLMTRDPLALIRRPPPSNLAGGSSKGPAQRITIKAREFQIQKLLLLNAYPVAYIVLWIPGILNRFAELSGHNYRALEIAQSSTQFVGLANACKNILSLSPTSPRFLLLQEMADFASQWSMDIMKGSGVWFYCGGGTRAGRRKTPKLPIRQRRRQLRTKNLKDGSEAGKCFKV